MTSPEQGRWTRSAGRVQGRFARALAVLLVAGAGAGLWLVLSPGGEQASERPAETRAAANRGAIDVASPGRIARLEKARPRGPRPRSRVPPERTASGPAVSRVMIPSIGVDAAMIELGLNLDDSLEVPSNADETGWWTGGAFPGQAGTAVIAGHVDSTAGPAVFYRLGEVAPGDEIQVTARDGSTARFVVERSESVAKDAFPTRRVYEATRGPSLRLITCTGAFAESTGHYVSNLIVYARPA